MKSGSGVGAFPSEKKPTPYGYGLFATKDLDAGTIVQIFTQYGPSYAEEDYETLIPDEEKAHCLLTRLDEDADKWVWIITRADARYANHSCEPNCILNEKQQLVTFKPVPQGHELSFLYNPGSEGDWWDSRWSFKCGCGSDKCQGSIDRYRPFDRYGNKL